MNLKNKRTKSIWKIIIALSIIVITIISIVILKNIEILQRITLGNKAETEETKIEYEITENEENNLDILLKIENKERNRKGNSIRWNDIKRKK